MTYYTLGMLRAERTILVELIMEADRLVLGGHAIDMHYWNELRVQLKKLDWIIGERMALVV